MKIIALLGIIALGFGEESKKIDKSASAENESAANIGWFPALSLQGGYPIGFGPVLECCIGIESSMGHGPLVEGINLKAMPGTHACKFDVGFGGKMACFMPVSSYDFSISYMKSYRDFGIVKDAGQYLGMSSGFQYMFGFGQIGIYQRIGKSGDPEHVGLLTLGVGL